MIYDIFSFFMFSFKKLKLNSRIVTEKVFILVLSWFTILIYNIMRKYSVKNLKMMTEHKNLGGI